MINWFVLMEYRGLKKRQLVMLRRNVRERREKLG